MAKSNRSRAPRDRKRGLKLPDPNQVPRLPFPPPPVKPSDPGCSTGTGLKALDKLLRRGR